MKRQIKREIKHADAYLTVEAALVFPIVLGVILFTIYMLFFQYDRCLMEQNAGVLALRGCTQQITDKEELVRYLAAQSGQTDDRYLAWSMNQADISLSGNFVTITQSGQLRFPFGTFLSWQGEGAWNSEIKYRNYRIRPVTFVRNCRKIMGGK